MIGLGYMGLGMLQLLKLRGPSRIVAIDVREEARAAAMALGADESITRPSFPRATNSPILATGRATAGSTSSSKGPAPSLG